MDLYSVVLKEDVLVDPRVYGDLVAAPLGLTKLEARIAVKKARGIFLEDVSEEDANRVASRLRADGADCWVVANERMPVLAAPRRVQLVERSVAAMLYRWAGDLEPSEISWKQITVASFGCVALPEYRDDYAGIRFDHLPPLHAMKDDPGARDLLREKVILRMADTEVRRALQPESKAGSPEELFQELQKKHFKKLRVVADLISDDRTRWMRVTMDDLAWAHEPGGLKFGEAYAMTYLLQELRVKCPKALTRMTQMFAPKADISLLVFPTIEEFTRYSAWHAIRNHLWTSDVSSSPSPAPPAPPTDGGSSSSSPEPAPSST